MVPSTFPFSIYKWIEKLVYNKVIWMDANLGQVHDALLDGEGQGEPLQVGQAGELSHLVRPQSTIAHHCLWLHLQLLESRHVRRDAFHHEVVHKQTAHLTQIVEPREIVRDVCGADHVIVIWDMHWTLLQYQIAKAWTVGQGGNKR